MCRLAAPALGTNTAEVNMRLPLTSVDSGPGSDEFLMPLTLPSLLLGPGVCPAVPAEQESLAPVACHAAITATASLYSTWGKYLGFDHPGKRRHRGHFGLLCPTSLTQTQLLMQRGSSSPKKKKLDPCLM